MTSVRVYGIGIGNGSFARVTAGIIQGLRASNVFAGFVPVDAFDPEEEYEGATADIAVIVGPPQGVMLSRQCGNHRERLYMLAPNSSWVPQGLLRTLWPHATGFLSPSSWACDVLRKNIDIKAEGGLLVGKRSVELWQHGVDPEFADCPMDKAQVAALTESQRDRFSVLHMSSTARERKGTSLLVEAWLRLVMDGLLGAQPTLNLVMSDQSMPIESDPTICVHPQKNLSVADVRRFYRQHHLVVQPSRGEGFGMVPLEATAAGVPVCATVCTGHSEFMKDIGPSSVVIRHGDDGPIDDGPGALAPKVSASEIADALYGAYLLWPVTSLAARVDLARWSWSAVTRDWLTRRADAGQLHR